MKCYQYTLAIPRMPLIDIDIRVYEKQCGMLDAIKIYLRDEGYEISNIQPFGVRINGYCAMLDDDGDLGAVIFLSDEDFSVQTSIHEITHVSS